MCFVERNLVFPALDELKSQLYLNFDCRPYMNQASLYSVVLRCSSKITKFYARNYAFNSNYQLVTNKQ